jgi:hypothetical protein
MSAFILHDRFFDPGTGRISSYFCQLFVMVGQDSLQYGIFDTDKNSFIALADFRMPELPGSAEFFYAQLDLLLSSEEPLHKKYPSVVIGIDSPFHTLVPETFFEKDKIADYLQFNFKLPDDIITGYDRITEADAANLFGYTKTLTDIAWKNLPGAVIVHRSTAFIKAAHQQHLQSGNTRGIFLNIRNPFIDIVAFERNNVVFFNSFACKSKEDVLYFTLYALEQMNLRPETVALSLCGTIDAGSEIFRTLEEYIRQLTFTGLPGSFTYSPLIRQAKSHFYTELFGLALCGS